MDCEQIRPFLRAYVHRDLPTFKIAWVAQHLVGCEMCRTTVQELHPAPVATAAETPGSVSVAVQRRVPPWVKPVGVAGAVLLLLATFQAVRLAGRRPGPPEPRPSAPSAAVASTKAQVPTQSQLGVSLSLESTVAQGEEVAITARFSGRGLTSPPDPNVWLRVYDSHHQETPVTVTAILVTGDGLAIEARFRLPEGDDRFLLRFGAIVQLSWHRWLLLLPEPGEALPDQGELLAGTPPGTRLLEYRADGDMLRIGLRFPARGDLAAAPAFQLRDAQGALFAPVQSEGNGGSGERGLTLLFPLPREVRTPFTLVGSVPVHKQVGPWLMEANVVK